MAEESKSPAPQEQEAPAAPTTEAAPKAAEAFAASPAADSAPDASADNGKKEGKPTDTTGGGGGPRGGKRDETPIEELFDLTKPVARVPRPSKEDHETELAEIGATIDSLKEQRRKVQSKIDSTMDSNRKSAAGSQREALQKLRSRKGALIEEKKAIRTRLEAAKTKTDKLVKDRKDTKSSVKFTSIADIDKEIAKLQRRQETTSMSLAEEKRLIKEMDQLQASKALVEDLKSKDASLDGVKEQRKAISAEIGAKDKEIDAVQKEIDERQAELKKTQESDSGKRDELKALFAERDEIKKKMDEAFADRNECRQKFRDANNNWYNHQRAARAQKQMQYEEERKRRDEERAAWIKKKEEEEMKKIPYEEEMALCDYLADYLTNTYLTDHAEKKKKEEEEAAKKKQAGVVAVKDDPFAGLKPVSKKEDDVFLQMGKGKKKRRDRTSKKAKATAQTFKLSVDSFEQFGLINLSPPTALDQVEKSVEELRSKKKWYSEQPRGTVQTAQEIRKARERAAQKLRQSVDEGGKGGDKGGSSKGFSVSSDDFAPLGGAATSASGASSSLNASWGQKAVEGAPSSEPAATDAEDEKEGGEKEAPAEEEEEEEDVAEDAS